MVMPGGHLLLVGGGSVFFNLKQIYLTVIPSSEGTVVTDKRIYWINDINYELYCFWKVAQEYTHELFLYPPYYSASKSRL